MTLGVIPARYASSRFPGKPLHLIQGKSMLQRVYEQAAKAKALTRLVVATDDVQIAEHVMDFGGEVVMTSATHPSGTDRCFEALMKSGKAYEYIINIQGDEPFIDPSQIDLLASVLDGNTELATLIIPVDNHDVLFDEGEAKVVLNAAGEAVYFSRSVIPFFKNLPVTEWTKHHDYFRHVGMYAYRVDVLEQITRLPVSPLEKAESLEQLRWIENGYAVKCVVTQHDSHCIDTPEDVDKVLKLMGML